MPRLVWVLEIKQGGIYIRDEDTHKELQQHTNTQSTKYRTTLTMSRPTSQKAWILANKPAGDVKLSGDDATFKLETRDLPELKDNQVLVKVVFLSNDPAQRGWIDPNIDPERLYVPPVPAGAPMRARGIGEVVESTSDKFKKGQMVQGGFDWTDYVIVDASTQGFQVVQELPGGLSYSHYLGALGATGLTAYYGLVDIAEAKKGESVLVSGAAGATGVGILRSVG